MVFLFISSSDPVKKAAGSRSGRRGKVSAGAFGVALESSRSCRCLRPQSPQPDQVIRRSDEGEPPTHFPQTAQLDLLQQTDHLHPAKRLLDPLAFLLADRIAPVPRRPLVNGAAAVGGVLRHVRGDLPLAQGTDEVAGVIILVPSQSDAPGSGDPL